MKTSRRVTWKPTDASCLQQPPLPRPNAGWGRLYRGHHINVCNNATQHLLQERCVDNIRCATLLKVLLGMLNSGEGGRVFFGVSEGGVVEGISMTQQQRDCLMLGVSQCVGEIRPLVLPCDELVQFIPVLLTQHGSAEEPQPAAANLQPTDRYVVIITVRPRAGVVYRSRDSDDVILRQGASNVTLQGLPLAALLQREQELNLQQLQNITDEKLSLILL
ncbi:uncharacterized protein LOC108675254 [Hyalella azteca]|uniref:Uncharacterized protein LOC108675254 n=1 Tax=Hyalella azteca TaxID=294128 RepID=A0A8B7NYB7_HYAAZ|nr:uncharacterized protein LOC108675254 [Hyalella azteca]